MENVIEIGGVSANETAKKRTAEDVDRIVNNPDRQRKISKFYKERREKARRKILFQSVVAAFLSFLIGLMCKNGVFAIGFALPVQLFLSHLALFFFGRWFEMLKNRW